MSRVLQSRSSRIEDMRGKADTAAKSMDTLTAENPAQSFHLYRKFKSQLAGSGLKQFRNDLRRLRASLAHLQTLAERQNQQLASEFNLFSLLGVVHDEVYTHSAFLANLLDPDGTHGQNHLFLKSFLRMCASKYPELSLPVEHVPNSLWFVEQEKATLFGCMDLVITCPDRGWLLVIENKVMAGEQEHQLKRYSEWMETQRQHYVHRALYYLTPTGRESDSSAGCRYFKLSYHHDIYEWLDSALASVRAPRVKEAVAQYTEIIAAL